MNEQEFLELASTMEQGQLLIRKRGHERPSVILAGSEDIADDTLMVEHRYVMMFANAVERLTTGNVTVVPWVGIDRLYYRTFGLYVMLPSNSAYAQGMYYMTGQHADDMLKVSTTTNQYPSRWPFNGMCQEIRPLFLKEGAVRNTFDVLMMAEIKGHRLTHSSHEFYHHNQSHAWMWKCECDMGCYTNFNNQPYNVPITYGALLQTKCPIGGSDA